MLALFLLEVCWSVWSVAVGASQNDLGHNKQRAGNFELVYVLTYETYFQLGKIHGNKCSVCVLPRLQIWARKRKKYFRLGKSQNIHSKVVRHTFLIYTSAGQGEISQFNKHPYQFSGKAKLPLPFARLSEGTALALPQNRQLLASLSVSIPPCLLPMLPASASVTDLWAQDLAFKIKIPLSISLFFFFKENLHSITAATVNLIMFRI